MSVSMAYFGVVLIWSTTPLAIFWSSHGAGAVFGVTSRILIGAALAMVATVLLGHGMVWHRRALAAYVASGLGIFLSMLATYWGAQYIPSGWISVLFGMAPLITALMARLWLEGEPLTLPRLFGMLMGLTGLAIIFGTSLTLQGGAVLGVAGVLFGVSAHSASAVWVKRIDAGVPALVITSGGLAVAAPLFLAAWWLTGGGWPAHLTARTLGAIGYLALFGSVFGFAMYYYVLRHVQATRVALITLITPMAALGLGHLLNGEPLTPQVITGSALILSGLALFERIGLRAEA
ncbi:MAG TPA: DMT family transporter [Mariprofundaceae bacterium]|nr:DMT family transporter [Mariprofundaceae bacterium]